MRTPWTLLLVVVGADQASKHLTRIFDAQSMHPSHVFSPLVALLVACVAFVVALRSQHPGLWLIFSGGVSNLLDTFTLGYVADVAALGPLTGNLADFAILTGVFLLIKPEK